MHQKFLTVTTHLPEGGLYFVEEAASLGILNAVIYQSAKKLRWYSNNQWLKVVWRKHLKVKQHAGSSDVFAYLSRHLPDFKPSQVVDNEKLGKLISLGTKYGFTVITTSNINRDNHVRHYLEKNESKYICVLGGRILNPSLLLIHQGFWINGHGGIIPYYRGLMSEYWAIKNKDTDNIGCTIHYLTTKIDAGKPIRIRKIHYNPDETFGQLILRNHANLVSTYLDVIKDLREGRIVLSRDESEKQIEGSYYSSPPEELTGMLVKKVGEII